VNLNPDSIIEYALNYAVAAAVAMTTVVMLGLLLCYIQAVINPTRNASSPVIRSRGSIVAVFSLSFGSVQALTGMKGTAFWRRIFYAIPDIVRKQGDNPGQEYEGSTVSSIN